jgi:hypothetical protein
MDRNVFNTLIWYLIILLIAAPAAIISGVYKEGS